VSKPAKEHHGDLLKFDDGTKTGFQMTRWEYLMDLYTEFGTGLPEKFTVTPFAERTDIVAPVQEEADVLEAAEMFEDDLEAVPEDDECYEAYEIDF